MPDSPNKDTKWEHPRDVLKFQKLRLKKKALQERINGSLSVGTSKSEASASTAAFQNIFNGKKRKNPFLKDSNDSKRSKIVDNFLDESSDQTLFKLFNQTSSNISDYTLTSFDDILTNINEKDTAETETAKAIGKPWCPIDWTLKRKIRLISLKPFPWNQKLKISEEASGITSFTRCLDIDASSTKLNASPNAKFHQCCLFWQQPFLPWLPLFPRSASTNSTSGINLGTNTVIKNSLYQSWTDSFKSLFQLIRTRQCPYFYVCANSFTALFRAAGILGYIDVHVIVTPSTRGFRHMLQQEEIAYTMPLRNKKILEEDDILESATEESDDIFNVDQNIIDEDDTPDEEWLKTMGINAEDIKQINYTQARIEHKTECEVDSSDQSLILIEGVEVNAFFNFLINCKSAVPSTGPLAGIPPTLLAPVSFHGATLNALKVRDNKIHSDGINYYSLELTGPVLPSTLHNLFNINAPDHSMTVTFSDIESTRAFSRILRKNQRKSELESQSTTVFGKENLSECGLNLKILKHFCSADSLIVSNIECLKYSGDNETFTWT